ncbi:DUF2797 domain-containing protein [Candidatus Micrarchaeota archaeon]|nr:DUF2797 domain-containing protein [Candidatus Micrarchaeota archaeon]
MLIIRNRYTDALVPALQTDGKEILFVTGESVSLALSPEVYCLGFGRDGKRYTCAKKSTGRKQCATCQKEDDFLVCLRCDGATCLQFTPQIKDDCFGKDYSVYLASFGETVKAGVTKTQRVQKRWVEQGADFACKVFGNVNGQQARVIESMLVRAGYVGRHTTAEKLKLPQADQSAIADELASEHFQRIAKAFEKNAIPNPDVVSLQSHYPEIPTAKPTDYLQGTILGAKGPILFLEQNGSSRVFGLPDAVGRKVLTNTLAAFA